MSRRRTAKKRVIVPDPIYQNVLIETLVRHIMKDGKKFLAYRIIYESMRKIAAITKQKPLIILERAIQNITPLMEMKARRKRGYTYQLPIEVANRRGTNLAIRWLLAACRKRIGTSTSNKLTQEILDAYKNSGNAVRKKEEIHRMAEANKVFLKKI